MGPKQKPCTLAAKHKWEFVKNVTLTTTKVGLRGTTKHIRFRGIYSCACGERRTGVTRDEVQS